MDPAVEFDSDCSPDMANGQHNDGMLVQLKNNDTRRKELEKRMGKWHVSVTRDRGHQTEIVVIKSAREKSDK